MAVKHVFVSPISDAPDATLVRPSNWNADHVFSGGSHGQGLSRDTGQTDGSSWAWFIPATAVASDGDIPTNQVRIVASGTSPSRTIAVKFNDAGTIRTLATITF